MSEQKTSLLPKVELLILGVFLISFILYATSKCSATKARYAEEASEEALADSTSQTQAATTANALAKDSSASIVPSKEVVRERYTPLYVTMAGLNVRAEPKLNAKVLDRLALYEEVLFMNEITDFAQEIVLGKIIRNDPWVKIQTKKGRTGWVFGAGVHYYKIKLEGVE
ncbi:MAG: SH3 domain-containing protein [Saprospiraceae bacterium]|nr:SH3 domain-containing protein [Saprospiraceae bacterium]MDZ4702411.1 SH3 domain-containing protein [Saprospiraceae bacterium]